MDQDEQLRNLVKWRAKRRVDKTVKLGEVATELMENRITPQWDRFGAIVEVWEQLLPSELRRHCEIAGVSGGKLKVRADSPSYLYELRLCSSEILSQLQWQCPRAKIKKIEFTAG